MRLVQGLLLAQSVIAKSGYTGTWLVSRRKQIVSVRENQGWRSMGRPMRLWHKQIDQICREEHKMGRVPAWRLASPLALAPQWMMVFVCTFIFIFIHICVCVFIFIFIHTRTYIYWGSYEEWFSNDKKQVLSALTSRQALWRWHWGSDEENDLLSPSWTTLLLLLPLSPF